MKNLINKTFNNLTVLERDYSKKQDAHIYWICKCECGNIVSVRSTNLRTGKTTSCGCKKRIDISNQKFGKLIALNPTDKRSGTHIMWHCKCDCGQEIDIDGHSLRAGLSKSCGCNKQSKGEEKIEKILNDNKISYEKEKIFSNFKYTETGFYPRFDFYVNNQYLIEFDGKQHYENCFNVTLEEVQNKDSIKNQWCKDNNIPLIRIPYWHLEKMCIEDLLLETSNFVLNDE